MIENPTSITTNDEGDLVVPAECKDALEALADATQNVVGAILTKDAALKKAAWAQFGEAGLKVGTACRRKDATP